MEKNGNGLKRNYKVMMAGNNVNDILTLKEADIEAIITRQEEKNPQMVYNTADIIVENIKEILDIDFLGFLGR